jgi:hypothetical protein
MFLSPLHVLQRFDQIQLLFNFLKEYFRSWDTAGLGWPPLDQFCFAPCVVSSFTGLAQVSSCRLQVKGWKKKLLSPF